nr:carboxylesterase family protein [Mycobacterium eburneum]
MLTGSRRRVAARALTLLAAVPLLVVLAAGCGRGGSATPHTPVPVAAHPVDPAVVSIGTGMVRGVVSADYRLFAGLPYAAPPVGPLRWQPPRPAAPWPGVRDASKTGPWCLQGNGGVADPGTSEDCLTLNVWTPPLNTTEKRPVMVWIHGGGFVNGSGDIYNARWLATQGDIVVVTINYRLGALGFLAHPALGEVGNYGLADQQAALRWVRDNIASFGGDPTKVTIAGESAGGMSVCDHLVAPGSAGLFRAAIIQSGPCQAQVDVPTAQRVSQDYAAAVGCADPGAAGPCLRALPAGKLAEPLWYARFGSDRLSGPVTGTRVLPVDPVAVTATGGAAKVPVLIGTNADEFTMFVALQYLREGKEITAAEYPGVLADTFGAAIGPAVLAHYPPERYGGSVSLAYAAAATDDIFSCLADRMTDGFSDGAPAVYAYEFDDRHAPAPEMYERVPFPIGASHSLEMRYLFDVGGAPPLDAEQRALSQQMIAYWSHFVTTGAPKATGAPDWPKAGHDGPWLSLRTDGNRVTTSFEADHQCPFWAAARAPR